MFQALKGSGLKTRLLHPIDTFWEMRFGVDTLDWIPAVGDFDDGNWQGAYVPARYQGIVNALRLVRVGPGDSFVDLGCGLGRAVFAAAWLGARRSVGVEIDERLCNRAKDNAKRTRVKAPIEFIAGSATDYVPSDTTVLFMFNPFGATLMKTVIENFEREMRARPRKLRIVYENPLQAAVLDASPMLRRTVDWASGQAGNQHPVSFWESR
jgi:SAM-dependent methyltransferase